MARLVLIIQREAGFTEEDLTDFFENEVEARLNSLFVNGTRIISWKVLPLHGPFDPSPRIVVNVEGPHIDLFLPAIAKVLCREIKAIHETETVA